MQSSWPTLYKSCHRYLSALDPRSSQPLSFCASFSVLWPWNLLMNSHPCCTWAVVPGTWPEKAASLASRALWTRSVCWIWKLIVLDHFNSVINSYSIHSYMINTRLTSTARHKQSTTVAPAKRPPITHQSGRSRSWRWRVMPIRIMWCGSVGKNGPMS